MTHARSATSATSSPSLSARGDPRADGELTGLHQGRLSEYRTGKRRPKEYSVFEAFADGLGLPPAARQALGLDASAPAAAGLGVPQPRPASFARSAWSTRARPSRPRGTFRAVAGRPGRSGRAGAGWINPGAWNEASLRWLVAPVSPPEADVPGGVRVGMGDVERFR